MGVCARMAMALAILRTTDQPVLLATVYHFSGALPNATPFIPTPINFVCLFEEAPPRPHAQQRPRLLIIISGAFVYARD